MTRLTPRNFISYQCITFLESQGCQQGFGVVVVVCVCVRGGGGGSPITKLRPIYYNRKKVVAT